MILSDACYLLDVNVLVARIFEDHIHHGIAREWFSTPRLEWAICPFTEAGLLRYATTPGRGGLSIGEATAILEKLTQHQGCRYFFFSHGWQTLTKPFSKRLHGHNQITDAYLLGLAVQERLILVTFDRAILHLAGEHQDHVLVLGLNR
jgi:toxin-antitoxin system PIN domain toxin